MTQHKLPTTIRVDHSKKSGAPPVVYMNSYEKFTIHLKGPDIDIKYRSDEIGSIKISRPLDEFEDDWYEYESDNRS